MEPETIDIIIYTIIGWTVIAFLAAAAFGWYAGRMSDDEYMRKYSDLNRERKKLTMFEKKQAD